MSFSIRPCWIIDQTLFDRSVVLLLSLIAVHPTRGGDGAVDRLLAKSCLECHDDASEKGELSFEFIALEIADANAAQWLRSLEQIERGFMPPAEKDQPDEVERDAAIRELEEKLVAHYAKQPRKPTTIRRLNQTEYRNTIRDLLKLNLGSYDPTSEFPADQLAHGFASNGETLVTSGFLLRQQLDAAEKIISRSVDFGGQPETKRWDLKPPFDRTTKGQIYGEANHYSKTLKVPQPYQTIAERTRGIPKAGFHPIDELNAGVPVSGWYRIRIEAEARDRFALDQSKFKRFPSMWDETEPIRLTLSTATLEGIDPDNNEARDYALTYEQSSQRNLATWDLPDDEKVWLECRVWLDAGHFPRLSFPNGPSDSNNRLQNYFKDNAKNLLSPEEFAVYEKEKSNWRLAMFFKSPRVQLYQIQVEGPLIDEWPPASHRIIFGDSSYDSSQAEAVLNRFASRAWRRPVESGETASLLKLVQDAEKGGMTPEKAIQEGLKGILCAPGFLFREESEGTLTSNELASRLSYFLWASMPDGELLDAVAKNPESLKNQAERLLNDSRADAFVDEFLDGWLQLRKLGSMAPDVRLFSQYYSDDLEGAMRKETRLFFKHLLNTNGSIERLLDSNYTFLNKELADLYKIDPALVAAGQSNPEVAGLKIGDLGTDGVGKSPSTRFVQVALSDPLRGGLLGQGSVLTLTANGVDTSPVKRGVWLLENILGTPPSPPPSKVPAIEPDIRGATTIREQLEKHRESRACRSCHAHIDPPGFALESFDAIGAWRGHYRTEGAFPEVDSAGSFRGQEFKSIVDFKKALLEQKDDFTRSLVEKLLIHALGRELEVTDRPYIREMVEASAENGYRLRDLILGVVDSELFRLK